MFKVKHLYLHKVYVYFKFYNKKFALVIIGWKYPIYKRGDVGLGKKDVASA